VLKVLNAALRFVPQDTNGQRNRTGNWNGQSRRQSANAGGGNGAANSNSDSQFAPPTAPVLAGQTRVVWVLGTNGQPDRRRIKIGLTDGASTEVVEGNLVEGEMVITGQTLSSANRAANSNQAAAPGFGGAPRGGGAGGGGRGR
jgi:HlyD family secretion protein